MSNITAFVASTAQPRDSKFIAAANQLRSLLLAGFNFAAQTVFPRKQPAKALAPQTQFGAVALNLLPQYSLLKLNFSNPWGAEIVMAESGGKLKPQVVFSEFEGDKLLKTSLPVPLNIVEWFAPRVSAQNGGQHTMQAIISSLKAIEKDAATFPHLHLRRPTQKPSDPVFGSFEND